MKKFVHTSADVYYKEMLVYNMHSLKHLHQDVLIHGPLDRFSAFDFENGMQYLKRLVRTNHAHLSQVVNRVSECSFLPLSGHKTSRNLLPLISEKPGDNCFLTKASEVCVVTKVLTDNNLECQVFKNSNDVYAYPCKSSKLSVRMVERLSTSRKVVNLSEIFKKCILLPCQDKFFSVPIVHT